MASKRRIRKSQCGTKIKYSDHNDAVKALSSLYNRTSYLGRVYRCSWCGKYHIGRKPKGTET